MNTLLPEIDIQFQLKENENLRFSYRRSYNFPNGGQLLSNFLLKSFNVVVAGNSNLENEKTKIYSLSYNKFSFFKRFHFGGGLFYNRKKNIIKNITSLNGINQSVSYLNFNGPEDNFKANFNFNKKIGSLRLGFVSTGNYRELFSLQNNNVFKNITKSISIESMLELSIDKLPNFELGYIFQPSIYETKINSQKFVNNEYFFAVNYNFCENFELSFDFKNINYQDKFRNSENTFNITNASLSYYLEDSAWSFKLNATNLLNNRFRRQNTFTDFLISDETEFIFPRVILLNISYKL